MIPEADLRALLAKIDHVSPSEAQRLLAGMSREVDARCAKDGLFWLKFVKTRDEADPNNAIKPFPLHLEYIHHIWREMESSNRIVVAKSRQMLMSWIVACFCTHHARYKANQAIYWQTKAWEDAVAAICMPQGGFRGRCQFIEDNLPDWMKQEYKPAEGRIQYPNGSIIQALAGGADKIRSKVASLIVEDEFAFQEDQDGVYTAVAPLVQKGTKAIFISSPNGTANCFATLYHGRPVTNEQPD